MNPSDEQDVRLIQVKMNVQYPYRAVICGEEHIVKGCRVGNLLTDKGEFIFSQFAGGYPLRSARFLEVATLQLNANGEWFINGHNLHSFVGRPDALRLGGITNNEALRVHKAGIRGVAWVQATDDGSITSQLDAMLRFWATAAQPIKVTEKPINDFLNHLSVTMHSFTLFKGWSQPIWLTGFHQVGVVTAEPTREQIELASVAAELKQTKTQLRKIQAAANKTLKEAMSKWMRFDPSGMSADTKARIEKAVKLYLTDPEKHSPSKIAAEFKVSRTSVSKWFTAFTKETGFPVVTHQRHESVADQFEANSGDDVEE